MKQFLAINHHANACKGSQIFANYLINYLNNKLNGYSGDPDIAALITFYFVFVKEYNDGYATWHDAFNFEMSTTIDQNTLLDELTKVKAPAWVVDVWKIYPKGSAKAKALIPHDRQAFISGNVYDRIAGITTFIKGCGTDAALATVKIDATAFLTTLQDAVSAHDAAVGALKSISKDQEKLRIKTTDAMLGVEGGLTKKFFDDPEKVDTFFAISAMRRRYGKPSTDEGYPIFLQPNEIKLLDIKFKGTEVWEVSNVADHDACIFFSDVSTVTVIPPVKFVIPAGESLQIDLNTLRAEFRFAYAANLSDESDGELNIVQVVK